MVWLKTLWQTITKPYREWREKRRLQKRIEELKKRDPFIYKQMFMTEFKEGIFNLLKRLIGGSSLTLAIIYTLGHIVIAMICNNLITGASFELAAVDAVVEPIINGVWFFILHSGYKKYRGEK